MDTEITVALIGGAGVCGTIVGTVVGARIQARGGHAQAQAARDAAATAAQASRRHALHELRWTTLTALLRAASECIEATEHLYTSSQARPDAEREVVERVYHAFRLAYAEAELAAPHGMESVLTRMNSVVMGAYSSARGRAPTERALRALDELSREGDSAGQQAKEALARLRAAGAPLWNPRFGDPPPEYAEAIQALNAVPRLDREQVRLLLTNAAVPHEHEPNREDLRGAMQERAERRHSYQAARQELIAATRKALGTNDG
ncbi:hypothetical protein [Streptomyces sp. R33]|uniref:Secreted protein n=1 Tax=Streptomyces sp. R33 TaxID=3238629 RepID=A0AB39YHR1_9ACTN